MTSSSKYITLNSMLLFVIASITVMTLHEAGHFFAAILVQAKHISIYHNYTTNRIAGLPLSSELFIQAAGPLVSLAIGLIFHYLCSRQAGRNTGFLFKVYMSAFGYIGFFGYLLIAPVFPDGDTGYICHALGFPLWLTIAIALCGALALFLLINALMKYFVGMGTYEIVANRGRRKRFMRSLLIYPLMGGIALTTLLNLPVHAVISLAAPVCCPLSFLWGYGSAFYKKYDTGNNAQNASNLGKLKPWLLIVFVLIVIVNRALAHSISWN